MSWLCTTMSPTDQAVKRAVPKEISTGGTTSGMREINFNSNHQQVLYSPRYDVLPSYAPIPGYAGYPYGMFKVYLNGGHGLMGMAANGYNRIVGAVPNGIPSQLGEVVVDNNSLVSSGVPMDGNINKVQNGVEG
ncbi:hypothetical protein Tco_0228810 [Tanacetum coccineum]